MKILILQCYNSQNRPGSYEERKNLMQVNCPTCEEELHLTRGTKEGDCVECPYCYREIYVARLDEDSGVCVLMNPPPPGRTGECPICCNEITLTTDTVDGQIIECGVCGADLVASFEGKNDVVFEEIPYSELPNID